MRSLPEKTILIETSGGLIDTVYGDDASIKVLLIDWDEVEAARDKEPGAIPLAHFILTPSGDIPAPTREVLRTYGKEEA